MKGAKNIEIEYLRAVAIAMTVLGHIPVILKFYGEWFMKLFSVYLPWSGVDLFFCISGFVVSKAYVDTMDRHRKSNSFWVAAKSFWVRRIYRLLPTAWLWIVIPFLLSIVFNRAGVFGSWYDNLRSFTAVATFSGNVANQFGRILGPNAVYWSLALEEQFYFLFPLFLLLVHNTRKRVLVLGAMIVMQFFFDRNLFSTPAAAMAAAVRTDAVVWGVLIYLFSRTVEYKQFEPTFLRGSLIKKICLSLLLVYMLGAIPGQIIALPMSVGLIAIVSAILVFLASFNAGYIPRIPVVSLLLEWLGSRSYGIYVIHFPALRISYEIWFRVASAQGVPPDAQFGPRMLVTALVLLVVLSELNYRLVEQPLRRRGAAIAARQLNSANEQRVAVPAI